MIETLINKENLKQNGYVYKDMFADLHIYGKNDYRLLLEQVGDKFSIYGNYLMRDEGSLVKEGLRDSLQLDLFENVYVR